MHRVHLEPDKVVTNRNAYLKLYNKMKTLSTWNAVYATEINPSKKCSDYRKVSQHRVSPSKMEGFLLKVGTLNGNPVHVNNKEIVETRMPIVK